eukprot:gnl/MRDRNA2_/MRDRNA2_153176_c0_seq1.p1 gnl/MRDRNA2_/MRDRNA2_153176_c0~~gnl/MRDRNA2_/MRDRNA2_153176_c0_seq1.p1  ORF type:complete len:246 (+),score=54.23 gnl/MRDRNA2_/MRDRNA2_153176_c0_seq1:99-836(+)
MPAKKRPAAAITPEPMKLRYFPTMAKGLGPALVAELSGLPWLGNKDLGFSRETWPELKATGKPPFGQVPLLEDNGRFIGQSTAIVNYIGKKAKTEGKTQDDYAMSQMLLAEGVDLDTEFFKCQPSVGGYGYAGFDDMIYDDPMLKKGSAAAHAKFWDEWVPGQFSKLETLLAGKDKFTSSGRTVGEIYVWAMMHQMKLCKPDMYKETPNLGRFYESLFNEPGVQKVLKGESTMGELARYYVDPRP